MSPSGEDLCMRQVASIEQKAIVDLKRLEMNGALDLMGLVDPRVGYEYSLVADS